MQTPNSMGRGLTARFVEVLDGLLLGDGGLSMRGCARTPIFEVSQPPRHAAWLHMISSEFTLTGVETAIRPMPPQAGGRGPALSLRSLAYVELHEHFSRWYSVGGDGAHLKRVPPDVRLTPLALAYWFAGDGTRASNGYSVRFCTHGFTWAECEFLRDQLRARYGWQGEVFRDREYPVIRFSRSGDRLALRRMVVGNMPACFQHKLVLRESAPCSEAEAARRRKPWKLDTAGADVIRARTDAGEPYDRLASEFDVSEQLIGKIARRERWRPEGEMPSGPRRRGPTVRLTKTDLLGIAQRLAAGESQANIAFSLNISQSRISWLLKKGKLPQIG